MTNDGVRLQAERRWTLLRGRLQRRLPTALRRAAAVLTGMALAGFIAIAGCTLWVRSGTGGHIFTEQAVPAAPVALVLGAQVYGDGEPSPFLVARLDLARRLLVTGKVRVLLVSGDNRHGGYDEPSTMRNWLIDNGVPDDKIVLDYAGLDTYDSCARANRIFGVHQVTVVTQSYHLPRAVKLCRELGLDANGVGDDSAAQFREPWRKNSRREYLACVKAGLDVLTDREPVHLGRHETGVEDALRGN